MDVKGKISSSAQQMFSVLQAFCLFVCFYLFPVHIIHTAVNSLEGIQKTCMYLVQRNLEGYVSEAIVTLSLKRKPLS